MDYAALYDVERIARLVEIAKEKGVDVEVSYEQGKLYTRGQNGEIIAEISLDEYRKPPTSQP